MEYIKKTNEFNTVYNTGISLANKYLVMIVKKNETGENRLGVSVSKRVGNSVIRHRVKRVLKEIYRLREDEFHSGWDIVAVARTGAGDCSYSELESAVIHLMKKHNLVKR